jgi:uncharacterized protein YebE (UPF0316 family)
MKLLIIFIVFNALNVIIQTVKSLATIKCGKTIAALINAVAYGLYTYIVVLTVCDLPLWQKMIVVALCNFVGVFIVKWVEEKARKDKLWKVEMAIPNTENCAHIRGALKIKDIPFNYVEVGKYVMFNCYCQTQKETEFVKGIAKSYNGKISAYESKNL